MENKLKYTILETSTSLLVAYEVLANAYDKARTRRESFKRIQSKAEEVELPTKDFSNYNYSFSMLVLNASIIEGVLRSILSEIISDDADINVQKGISEGQTEPSKLERLHYKFRDEIEAQGGWNKLKEQYSLYLNISLDKVLSKEFVEGVDVLFVLRNIMAHGTAIIHPQTSMSEEMKEMYPYTWQRKLQRTRVYLQKQFGHEDVFDNLAEYDLPIHFLNITKAYFNELESVIDPMPARGKLTIDKLKEYSFSKIYLSR